MTRGVLDNIYIVTLRDPSLGLRMNRCQTESRVSLLSLCRGAKEGNSKFISRYFCILGKQLYYLGHQQKPVFNHTSRMVYLRLNVLVSRRAAENAELASRCALAVGLAEC